MNQPTDLRYTKTHEWVHKQDTIITVGITSFAQHQLSDITYVELPEIDKHVEIDDELAVVESIKAASDVYAPVAGTIIEVNEDLEDCPELINSDPYGEGWIFKMEPDKIDDVNALMNADQYEATLPDEE